MLKNKKTLLMVSIILIVIVLGIVLISIKGMNYGIEYGKNSVIKINLEEQVEIEDIIEEIFGKKYNIKFANNNKENVVVIVKSVSDEQIDMLISKINEKYNIEISEDDFEITSNVKVNEKDLIRQYFIPTIITVVITLMYFIIRYKKIGILEVAVTALITMLGTQLLYLSIYAIVRIPVNELTMPISMLILILSFVGLAEAYDKKLYNIKSNEK